MDAPRIALVSTGGTIEKTYDALSGVLSNRVSVLDMMLSELQLRCRIHRIALMNKDSLDFHEEDWNRIIRCVKAQASKHDGMVLVHGTDRLAETGELLVRAIGVPDCPVVLTGAMRPWEVKTTDALQNLTEALLAVQLIEPGFYVAMHNRVLAFPGVVKDRQHGTFVREEDLRSEH